MRVLDSTNALIYEWNAGMASASVFKHFASGTTLTSYSASNGITPVLPSAGNQAGVTIGSGLHTNSSTYSIELWP